MAEIVPRRLKTGTFFYVRYSIEGRRYWHSAGRSLDRARRERRRIERELRQGIRVEGARSTWTLARLAELYLARMDLLRPKSARWRRERFRPILRELGEDLPLEDVTLGVLDEYADRRLRAGRAVSTVNGEIAVLRHSLSQARRWREETGLSEYRLADWRPIRADGRARRATFLSPDEVARVLEAARARARGGTRHTREGEILFRIMLATAARPAEILALRWVDLDPISRALRLETVKRGEPERAVTLDLELVQAIRALPRDHETIFEPVPRCLPKDRFKKLWAALREDAGIHARPYDLRHTAISEMLRRGISLREVQRIVGHRSSRMTERYAHFAKDTPPPAGLTWARAVVSPLVSGPGPSMAKRAPSSGSVSAHSRGNRRIRATAP